MKILLPFLNGSLRADRAIAKAGEKAEEGDELVLLYIFPAAYSKKVSFEKLLFTCLCGNYILNYAEEKLKHKKSKNIKIKKLFRIGDECDEIKAAFSNEACELMIIEAWHPRELQIVENISLPKITFLKSPEFPHTKIGCEPAKPAPLEEFGKEPLDQILWKIYSNSNKKSPKKPTPDYPIMPADWEASLTGRYSSIFLLLGMVYEKELLEQILLLGKSQENENRFLNISRRLYVLLKYKDRPKPKKKEWWAEKEEISDEIKPWCIRELLKKMRESAYLSNEERFFITSFLGHHLHIYSKAILALFRKFLIDYEPKIAAYNVYQVLGLLDSHPYVVSDRFARTHSLCLHCDKYYGYCALDRFYKEWVSKQSARGVEKLSNF